MWLIHLILQLKVYLKAVGHLLFPLEIGFHTYFKSYLCWEHTEIREIEIYEKSKMVS